jgi:TRAP-type uncharacterized transport system substrate-binding protein
MQIINISEKENQRQMEIRDFSNELLKYLTEHSNVYKVNHNLSDVWDNESLIPNINPKYCIILKNDVSEDVIVEIEDFIHEKSSRIPYMVEEYAPNVVKIEGIYYPLT